MTRKLTETCNFRINSGFWCGSHYFTMPLSTVFIAVMIICHSCWQIFLATAAKHWLCLQCFVHLLQTKNFCCFSFWVPFPRQPFVSESPGLLLQVFNWSPAGLPPLLPQSQLQMKNLWLYALKTSHSIWSAAVPLMLPPLMETASAVFIRPVLFLTVGVQIRERGAGRCPRLYSFIDIHSSRTDSYCLCAIIKHWCFWKPLTVNPSTHSFNSLCLFYFWVISYYKDVFGCIIHIWFCT